jgi:hypothetical protein
VSLKKFKTKLERKGGWTIAVIPFNVKKEFGTGGPVRVKGAIDKKAFGGCSMIPMGNGKHALTINAETRKFIKKEAGQTVEIILEPDTSELEIPAELSEALEASEEAKLVFDSYSYSMKRNYVYHINQSSKKETREKRAVKAVLELEKVYFEKGIREKRKKRTPQI